MFGRKQNKTEPAQPEHCSFCGKPRAEVELLIAGPDCAICDACVALSADLIADQRQPEPAAEPPAFETVLDRLHAASVVASGALTMLARALSWRTSEDTPAPRVLLVGPTGSGKTTLAKALGPAADRPLACIDLNRVTATGYIGEDVENVIHDLVLAADQQIPAAERGVLVFDGLHHAIVGPRDGRLTRDVSARDVQRHLLRVLNGEVTRHQHGPLHPQAPVERVRTAGMCVVLTAQLDDPGTDAKAIRDRLRSAGVLGELLARIDLIVPLPRLHPDQLGRVVDEAAPLILGRPVACPSEMRSRMRRACTRTAHGSSVSS
jgi:ATP-dependent Clp protease ATP-binding subunit ClpX